MSDKQEEKTGPESLLEAWMKTSADFWESAYQGLADSVEKSGRSQASGVMPGARALESWESAMKTWKAMSSLMGEPASVESLTDGIRAFPEILMKLVKPTWGGFLRMQQEWAKRAARIGESTAAYKFENLDQEAFKVWAELYEKEFRHFLEIPQLGLTRGYQERMNQLLDRFNIFQAAMAEFISVLCLPVEKSLKVIQDELAAMAEKGKLPEKSKEYYRIWVKILEGHYMNLFKSPEYNRVLANTLNAMGQFAAARERLLQDALQALPVPTQKDMDELYKEIYLLKKRTKELEKKAGHD